jgi:ferredoxin--NADP+ reductase
MGARQTGQVDGLLAEREIAVVSYEGWQAIDAAECAAGEPHGRPRIKLHRWDALLHAARRRS